MFCEAPERGSQSEATLRIQLLGGGGSGRDWCEVSRCGEEKAEASLGSVSSSDRTTVSAELAAHAPAAAQVVSPVCGHVESPPSCVSWCERSPSSCPACSAEAAGAAVVAVLSLQLPGEYSLPNARLGARQAINRNAAMRRIPEI